MKSAMMLILAFASMVMSAEALDIESILSSLAGSGGLGANLDLSKLDLSAITSLLQPAQLDSTAGNFGSLLSGLRSSGSSPGALGKLRNPFPALPLDGLQAAGSSGLDLGSLLGSPLGKAATDGGVQGGLQGILNSLGNVGPVDRNKFRRDMQQCRARLSKALDSFFDQPPPASGNNNNGNGNGGLLGVLLGGGGGNVVGSITRKVVDDIVEEKVGELLDCEKRMEEAAARRRSEETRAFGGALNGGLFGVPRALGQSGRTPFTELFSSTVDQLFSGSSGASAGGLGELFTAQGEALCKAFTDEDFRECSDEAENFCDGVESVEATVASFRSGKLNLIQAGVRIQEDLKAIDVRKRKAESSKKNCACVGKTLNGALRKGAAGRNDGCAAEVVGRVEKNAKEGAAQGATSNVLTSFLQQNTQANTRVSPLLPREPQAFSSLLSTAQTNPQATGLAAAIGNLFNKNGNF